MNEIGIEYLNIYGGSMALDQRALATARERDPERVVNDFLIQARSLNPTWEDTVTMAANAAMPLLDFVKREDIGLLVVGTEGSVDFGKPISSNVHSALELPSNVRNFETKFACYSGIAALETAINWVASGRNRGKKALVISSDFSRMHLNMMEEFVLGGLAAAAIVGDDPGVFALDDGIRGTWTSDVYDTFRPSARHEVGNNEVSLYTYMDALEGAWADYLEQNRVDFDRDFEYLLYHTPFPGMAFQAHRTVCNLVERRKKSEVRDDFDRRVLPGLRVAQQVGSTYGASNFAGLVSLLGGQNPPIPGSRIGLFAYGSGAIGEFYSGTIGKQAADRVGQMRIDEKLAARRSIDVPAYEEIEKRRTSHIEAPEFTPDFDLPPQLFEEHYRGSGRLVLKSVKDFYRNYERA